MNIYKNPVESNHKKGSLQYIQQKARYEFMCRGQKNYVERIEEITV